MELGYNNLPFTLMVKLEDNFRKRLFLYLKSKFKDRKELCKNLNCSVSSYSYYRRGDSFIPVEVFHKALKLCDFGYEEINSSVLQVKKRLCGKPICISLPTKSSPDLAALTAHALGDGHISSTGRFVYINTENTLIEKVKSIVNKIFNNAVVPYELHRKDGSTSIHYPSAVGEILSYFGCIKGNKTRQDFDIPLWIKDGDSETKSCFLRAIFDDEGSVSSSKISLHMSKIEDKKSSLIKFLTSMKNMLADLNVQTSRIIFVHKIVSKKNVKTVGFGFLISNYYTMKSFYENIGFCHIKKQKRLKLLLNSYVQPIGMTRNIILELLESRVLTISQIKTLLNMSKNGIKDNLVILENQGKITRIIISKGKHLWFKNE